MNSIFPQMRSHIKDVLEGRRGSNPNPKATIIELLHFLERALPIAKSKRTNETPTAVENALSDAYDKMQTFLCCERLAHELVNDPNVIPGLFLPESLVRVLLEKPLFSWQTRKIIESLKQKALQLQSGGRNWTTEDLRQCVADGFTWWGRNRKVRALEILENLDLLQPIDASFSQCFPEHDKESARRSATSPEQLQFPFLVSEYSAPDYRRKFLECAATQASLLNAQPDFDRQFQNYAEPADSPETMQGSEVLQRFDIYSPQPISSGNPFRSPQPNAQSIPVAPIADPNGGVRQEPEGAERLS
jgi:hypothetical protein